MGRSGESPRTIGGRFREAEAIINGLILQSIENHQPICFDTTAIIAYVTNEDPGSSLVAPLLEHPNLEIVISTLTLSEVIIRPARANDLSRVQLLIKSLEVLPRFRFLDFDRPHAVEAALVRAATGLKLPDAAIIATARLANASALIGNDKQWRSKSLGVPYYHLDDLIVRP